MKLEKKYLKYMRIFYFLFFIIFILFSLFVTIMKGCYIRYDIRFCNCVRNIKNLKVTDIKRKDIKPFDYLNALKAYTCGFKQIEYYKSKYLKNTRTIDNRLQKRKNKKYNELKNIFEDAEDCVENVLKDGFDDTVLSMACCTGKYSYLGKYETYSSKFVNPKQEYTTCLDYFKSLNINKYCEPGF